MKNLRKIAADALRNGHPKPAAVDQYPEDQRGDAWEPPAEELSSGPEPDLPPLSDADYKPFPVEALPEPLQTFVVEGATALGCDPCFVVLPALAAVAGAVGVSRVVELKRGWREPAVLWSAVVAESGTTKSPPWQLAVGPLFRRQRELLATYREEMSAYEDAAEAHREAKRLHRKGKGDDPGEAPFEPVLRRTVCSDTTIEKLVEVLEDNPRGVLVTRDELSGWIGSFCRYRQGGGSDLPLWLEAHRAGPWLVDRKTGNRRTLFVSRAAVSITGTTQPGTLARALTTEHREAGLAARLLLAAPPRRRKTWTEAEVSPETADSYSELLSRLLNLNLGKNSAGEPEPEVVHLSPEAREKWIEFYDTFAIEQAGATGDIAAALSKIEAYAARLALLYHLVVQVWAGEGDLAPLGPKSMTAGITLARWFAAEARRVYRLLTEAEADRELRELAEWVSAQGGRATARQLHRSRPRQYPGTETATNALDRLAQAGRGRWEPQQGDRKGGRPTQIFVLFAPR